jgi:hypothetical protein
VAAAEKPISAFARLALSTTIVRPRSASSNSPHSASWKQAFMYASDSAGSSPSARRPASDLRAPSSTTSLGRLSR